MLRIAGSWKGRIASRGSILGACEGKPSSRGRSSNPSKRGFNHIAQDDRPFRMAVVGSGPAGFYTALKVMSKIKNARVDMYEFLPVPFGLVRFGVAPDHPEVKNCQDRFTEVASSPRFNFVGNVEIGKDLPLKILKDNYDAILFAYGASQDRKLGIPGEDTFKGIHSARDFVAWYNGLPGYADLQPDLTAGENAVIIGQGNVALDVARTLLTDVDVLRRSDMAEHALAALARSKVKHVHVVGRRGPFQASFTIKEVRELMQLPDCSFGHIDPNLLPSDNFKLSRTPKRMLTLLQKGSNNPSAAKSWSLDFMLSPVSFLGRSGDRQLTGVNFVENEYQESNQKFEPSAQVHTKSATTQTAFPTSLAFRSIGYKSEAIEGMSNMGIQFDQTRGIIPNDGYGRITGSVETQVSATGPHDGSAILPGIYCAGWVKRGPAGVIANTMEDAFATAEAISIDWQERKRFLRGGDGWDAIASLARSTGLRPVSWTEWLRIDAVEKANGKLKGKEREKLSSISQLMSVLDG